ncbi:uncharacterized protein M6B38_171205 [Iris pallida]|uniref:Uncharacterized protein n=1 Tax=Iris pallida TaxID=29817 RepID=A0AAX6EUV7_IRIPA|nr:uncharacterized protein M6B38_171205 [Iris pallida]
MLGEHGNYFSATLSAKRICSALDSLKLTMYFWLMPHKVAVWIYLQLAGKADCSIKEIDEMSGEMTK